MINERIFTKGACDEEILFMIVGKEVSCQVLPWGVWYIVREHRLDCLFGLMLGTDLAMINIISNVSVYSWPVDNGLGEMSYLLYASVIVVEITECPFIQLSEYTHSFSL